MASALGAKGRSWYGHALCTLGVDLSYLGDPAQSVELLKEARDVARETGRLDELMRAYANLTTVLDLELRREEAVAVVEEGIAEARRWGQEHVYGNFLRGNAADCLFTLGRWDESRRMAESALAWHPTGLAFLNPLIYLTLVRVEQDASESAASLLGQALIEIEAVPDAQYSGPVYRSAASFALWRQDVTDAQRAIELGWRDDNPAAVIGARVTGYKYEPITRVLTHDEIRQLWAWTGDNAALLRFLLLTGLRISEAQRGRAEGPLWRVEKTKNGKPHWVFLSVTARAQTSAPFEVSPTAVQAWVKRRKVGWTPHDLRRTFATLAMDNGVLPHVVEKCLNHSLDGMLRVYAHSEMSEERIAAAKTVERVVLEITGATGSAGRKAGLPGADTPSNP